MAKGEGNAGGGYAFGAQDGTPPKIGAEQEWFISALPPGGDLNSRRFPFSMMYLRHNEWNTSCRGVRQHRMWPAQRV